MASKIKVIRFAVKRAIIEDQIVDLTDEDLDAIAKIVAARQAAKTSEQPDAANGSATK